MKFTTTALLLTTMAFSSFGQETVSDGPSNNIEGERARNLRVDDCTYSLDLSALDKKYEQMTAEMNFIKQDRIKPKFIEHLTNELSKKGYIRNEQNSRFYVKATIRTYGYSETSNQFAEIFAIAPKISIQSSASSTVKEFGINDEEQEAMFYSYAYSAFHLKGLSGRIKRSMKTALSSLSNCE